MCSYIDVVSEKLFENNTLEDIENILTRLNIQKIYVLREINNKEDFKNKFNIPKLNNITCEKIFLVKDLNINISTISEKTIFECKTIDDINKALKSKKTKYLSNIFSEKLIFDEGSANLAKQNTKKIIINLNDYREKTNKTSKIIKQSEFIFSICLKKKIDIVFCSFSKNIEELIDPIITINFLKIFDVPETLSQKLLKENL
jgi:hypothetical protein